jgi:predicted ATP-dependent endonuclease of OLD family
MNKLTIRNFGPIRSVVIDLKKFTVIIGPQSSGKSCILKIASFCKWLEKRIELSQNPDKYLSMEVVGAELLQFHKLNGFQKSNTFIKYESQFMAFSITFDETGKISFDFQWKRNRWRYKRPAIAYIPAERNIVAAIPNWFDVKLVHNNIRNYMSDWEEARQLFSKSNSLPILDLDTSYYFNLMENTDKIIVDKQGHTIDFTNASSGLQSIVPLYVLISYLSDKSTYQAGVSSVANDKEREKLKLMIERSIDVPKSLSTYEIIESLSRTQHTEIYLEEPEENIFPKTQYQLVKWLVQMMNVSADNCISMTTHSPYILSSLNNLIQAADAVNKDFRNADVIRTEILGRVAFVDFEDISVYAMMDGRVKTIKDEELRLISQSALDSASDDISEDFSKLLEL